MEKEQEKKQEKHQGRILFAGTGSGTGKTTITCGVLSELVKRGFNVTSFKCGPDYIDPMFHRKVIGMKSYNLDSFFLEKEALRKYFMKHAGKSDICVLEGVMGYYDGAGFTTLGSTYEIADITNTPVILIVNGKGMGNSVGAVIKGFTSYVKNSHVKGIILNHVSRGTYEKLTGQIAAMGLVPCGYLNELNEELTFENRHLGLISADEIKDAANQLGKLSEKICETVDVDKILEIAKNAVPLWEEEEIEGDGEKNKVKIGVAKDEAFSFCYKENLEILQHMGCEILYFSPLHDTKLPSGISGLILAGGYPEVHARKLSKNQEMRNAVKDAIRSGMPVIAECGGYMYLKEWLEDVDGCMHEMAGVIPGECKKAEHLVRFGYVALKAVKANVLCDEGDTLKGHEFHYWDSEDNGTAFLAEPASGKEAYPCIYADNNLFAGFPHLYFPANEKAAGRFVKRCEEYQNDRRNGKY